MTWSAKDVVFRAVKLNSTKTERNVTDAHHEQMSPRIDLTAVGTEKDRDVIRVRIPFCS